MALQKDIYDSGITCSYHKITGVLSSWNNNETIAIDITSYVNSDMRKQEKEDIDNGVRFLTQRAARSFQLMVPYTEDWSLNNLYTMLKDTEVFLDAIDC